MNRFIIFISVVLAVYSLMNFIAFRWLRFMFRPASYTFYVFLTLFCTIALLQPLGHLLLAKHPSPTAILIMQAGHIWLGLLFYFTLLGIVTACLYLPARYAAAHGMWNLTLAKLRAGFPITGTLIVGVLLAAAVTGMFTSRKPVIRSFNLPLPVAMNPRNELTIVHLTDTHLDELRSASWWESIVDKTNAFKPDLIMLTGDVIDENPEQLDRFKPGLSRLTASYGVFAVTGNHEFYIDTDAAITFLKDCGITVLRNEKHIIPGVACIIGIDDPTGRQVAQCPPPDFARLGNAIPDALPVIVLNHQPVYIENIRDMGAHLMLSGHTHNGQIWPFGLFTRLVFRYNYGYYRIDDLHLYVSSGTGVWGPPFRVRTDSEIAVFRIIPNQ